MKALESERAVEEFREAVQEQLVLGRSQHDIAHELEVLREYLRDRGREDEEDVVLDVMDFLAGWCSPHMKI